MGTVYTVGAKIVVNYDQSEIKSTIERLQNFRLIIINYYFCTNSICCCH